MKKSFLLLLLLAVSVGSWAIRPMHKAFPHKQSDGTVIMAYLHGDGFEAYYTSVDGKVLMRMPNGNDLCYARMQNGKLVASSLIAHEAGNRSAAELNFLAANKIDASSSEVKMLAVNKEKMAQWSNRPAKSMGTSTSDGLGSYGKRSSGDVPSIGKLTIPVIMVQFPDRSFQSTTTPALMTRVYNESGYTDRMGSVGSVKDYFVSQSDSMFVPSFELIGPITLDSSYVYYGANGSSGNDTHVMDMVREAIEKAVARGVDFSKYYVDGTVPLVSFLYAGPGEATYGGANTIWPHFRSLGYTYIGGYRISSYFVGNESLESRYADGSLAATYLMGMGVFIHEFGHALGLPDFYVTTYGYSNDSPMGRWSVMDEGEYYNNGYTPVGYNAYEKSYMGWLNIEELTAGSATGKTLKPGEAVLVRSNSDQNQYFILENRQPSTWYPSSLGSGLLNMRVAYSNYSWGRNNLNNTQSRKRMMVVTADSTIIVSDGISLDTLSSEHAYASPSNLYGNGVTNLPVFTMLNGTTQTNTPVYRVMKHADGTITLSYSDPSINNAVKGQTAYYKITDQSQIAAGDSIILVNEEAGVAMGKVNVGTNRLGTDIWLENGTAYATPDVQPLVYRQGNGFLAFQLTSSTYLALSRTNGVYALPNTRFRTSNDYKGSLSFENGNALLQFQGTGTPYLDYDGTAYDFVCSPDKVTTIQIYSRKRPATTGISTVEVKKAGADDIYTLTGQKVSRSEMRHGVYIVGGRKVVVK